MKSPTRVGFVTARWSSVADDGVWTEAGVGRIIDELANRFDEVHVAMSVAPERLQLHDYRLKTPAERFVRLPWLPGLTKGLTKDWPARQAISEIERRTDAVIVQLPFAAPTALVPPRKPRVYHLCADIAEIVSTSPWYQGAKKYPARGMAVAISTLQGWLIGRSNARIIANGVALQEQFGGASKGAAVVSATLLDREVMSVKRERSADGPFRILFVGYLRHEKGVATLLEACELLLERVRRPLELSVVGAKHSEDRGVTEDLKRGLDRLSSRMSVRFEGHKEFGPPLFQCFADADVLALPSLSEGTPRVLVEARAFGCPVVATRVGGIPTSVTDEVDGLLIDARDAVGLARQIQRLIDDPDLRARLKDAGLARARAHTVERFVDAMESELRQVLSLRSL